MREDLLGRSNAGAGEDAERLDWLRSYHDTYLQRDLADLARDAGTSPATARNYLEYLRLSYQAFLLPPWSGDNASGLVKSPKIFWADLGIARTLTGIHGPAPGPLFESLVVAEAQKLSRTLSLEAELSFYRSRSGLEVDLLVDTPKGLLAFEIKARETSSAIPFHRLFG